MIHYKISNTRRYTWMLHKIEFCFVTHFILFCILFAAHQQLQRTIEKTIATNISDYSDENYSEWRTKKNKAKKRHANRTNVNWFTIGHLMFYASFWLPVQCVHHARASACARFAHIHCTVRCDSILCTIHSNRFVFFSAIDAEKQNKLNHSLWLWVNGL